jgi:hypothetical protein
LGNTTIDYGDKMAVARYKPGRQIGRNYVDALEFKNDIYREGLVV